MSINNQLNRPDLALIADWIKPGSHVLDLGCGDGALLANLQKQKNVTGYGLEINDDYIAKCIRSGVNVIHVNLNEGLSDFDKNAFDYVILSMTLQAMRRPDLLLEEMLRVGTEGIVTFPNFGHWNARMQLTFKGRMPVTRCLPEQWYDTPNIHLCTIRDFEDLCKKMGFKILQRQAVDQVHRTSLGLRLFPNLLGKIVLYRFRRV